jgi:hypothetical protein
MDEPGLLKDKSLGHNEQFHSLKDCFDRSTTYIQQRSAASIKLFCLLGQLPGGIAIDDLN